MAVDRSKLPRYKLEELKRKEDEELTKEVYKDFVAAFSDEPSAVGKTFIRGGVVNAESGDKNADSKKLYKPKPTLYKPPPSKPLLDSPFESAKKTAEEKAKKFIEEAMKNRPQKSWVKKPQQKSRMSNLEAFKEELKQL